MATKKKAESEKEAFINFLESTLIPDLKESGRDATAEDFEKAVRLMRKDAALITAQRDIIAAFQKSKKPTRTS